MFARVGCLTGFVGRLIMETHWSLLTLVSSQGFSSHLTVFWFRYHVYISIHLVNWLGYEYRKSVLQCMQTPYSEEASSIKWFRPPSWSVFCVFHLECFRFLGFSGYPPLLSVSHWLACLSSGISLTQNVFILAGATPYYNLGLFLRDFDRIIQVNLI